MSAEYTVSEVLKLACSAQRANNAYLKEAESVYTSDGIFVCLKYDNKTLIRHALGIETFGNTEQEFRPATLYVEEQDTVLTEEIKSYYRRLMFAAVKGDNEFQTEVNSILNSETVGKNKIGFLACLPSVYARDKSRSEFKRNIKKCEDRYLAEVNTVIFDKDCEILESVKSKTFEGYNISAIIDSVMVSWFSKLPVTIGPAVLVKGKVKEHRHHWFTKNFETRLNYVKVIQ
jgi:hypothetical protein